MALLLFTMAFHPSRHLGESEVLPAGKPDRFARPHTFQLRLSLVAAGLRLLVVCGILSLLPAFLVKPVIAETVLRVVIYNNPPLVFVNPEGQATGLYVDLQGEIARQRGWQLEFVPGDWEDLCGAL